MEEFYERTDAKGRDLQHYLHIVRRRHIAFLLAAFFGWFATWGTSWIIPARYKSGTLILVEQPTMPRNYVVPNISDDQQTRLQSITQQILSRTRLLLIIDRLSLYNKGRRQLTPDEKVTRMRNDIDIELVRSTQGDEITAFRIYYTARDPYLAQRATSELTNLFINENLRVRREQSEDTTKFLDRRLELARSTLAEQEAKIREFKGLHQGELPSQEASNLQILSGIQNQLQNEQDTLNAAKQQRVYLQTLIGQYRTLHAPGKNPDGTSSSLSTIDQELARLRARLADLRSRYTEHYPEVENLKEEIATTEKLRSAFVSEAIGNSAAAKGTVSVASDTESLQNAPLLQLQSQLQANQAEIANREQTIAGLKSRINAYQDRLNIEPMREQELADLTRGYDQSKTNYDDLLKKQKDSEMATSMEEMQQGERFRMLDPPSLPSKADFPNRLMFCGIGVAGGLLLGFLVLAALEFLDDRLYSDTEIKALLSVAIISEIPVVVTPVDEKASKKNAILGWAMAAFVVATILAGSAISYLHG